MRDRPSDEFVASILRGYRIEKERATKSGKPVTASAIWDQVVMQCLRQPGGFTSMFAWDRRKASQNRIKTIMECIEAGYVPGLQLGERGRVEESAP